jgi:hypothetical protein
VNAKRVVLAGLLAGLVLNIGEAVLHGVVFADATAAAMKSLGHEIAGSGSDTAQLVLMTFIQGLLGMLLYAAVQPRWPAGIGTAIRVGLVLWVLSAVYSAIYLGAGFAGLMPLGIAWGPVAWELVLYPLAIAAGSFIHKER